MDSLVLVPLFAFAGAALTALVSWLVARRQRSGRIETSDAVVLWQEAKAMRDELRDETVELRREVLAMREETIELRKEAIALRDEARTMRSEVVVIRESAQRCAAEVELLRLRIAKVQP